MLAGLNAVPQDGDYKAFAQAYAAVVWLYVAIYLIGSSIGSLPLLICKGKKDNPEIVDDGPAFDLLETPNEFESGSELVEDTAIFMESTGNGYWEKWGMVKGLPVKLFGVEPYYITIKAHPTRKIDYYLYDNGSPGAKKKFQPQQMAHFKYTNPLSQFYGMGAVKPLQTSLITELHRESYNRTYFENEARPDVILTQSPDIAKGTVPMTDPMKRKFAQTWYKAFGGPRRQRMPVLLDGGMDIRVLSDARRDMDFREMEKSLRERIFAAFGIPPILAGLFDDVNYATSKEQVRIFWRVTLPPKCNRLAQTITRNILRPYDEELWCKFDLSDITALEETVKEREERLSRMLERGGISLGEYRQKMGFKIDPKDKFIDQKVMSANLIPLEDFFAPPRDEEEGGPLIPGEGGPPQTGPRGFPGETEEGEERA